MPAFFAQTNSPLFQTFKFCAYWSECGRAMQTAWSKDILFKLEITETKENFGRKEMSNIWLIYLQSFQLQMADLAGKKVWQIHLIYFAYFGLIRAIFTHHWPERLCILCLVLFCIFWIKNIWHEKCQHNIQTCFKDFSRLSITLLHMNTSEKDVDISLRHKTRQFIKIVTFKDSSSSKQQTLQILNSLSNSIFTTLGARGSLREEPRRRERDRDREGEKNLWLPTTVDWSYRANRLELGTRYDPASWLEEAYKHTLIGSC